VLVEVGGAVAAVEGADGSVVVVPVFKAWCRALEQLVAAIATTARTIPIVFLLLLTVRGWRR
jgi:hypothetical protein